ncbi:MAG: HlyD family secretion protein [Deltaproteobacteria bacterium]|nr:HlyD family secretion protein [Deltaproteobacteria bacterium]
MPTLKMKYQRWTTLLVSAAFVAIVGGFGVWWWISAAYVSTDDARIKAEIVAVSAEMTAKLNSLTKDEGDAVARDEVLATLDRRELEIQRQQAEAELDRLRSKVQQGAREIELHVARQKEEVAKAEAAVRASRHQLDDARAHAGQAKEDWRRNQKLFERQLVAEQELERARTSLHQADAQMSSMQEKIKEGESIVDLARLKSKETVVMEADLQARRADVRRAEAVLADLRRKLQLTTIRSPVAGVVVKKNSRPGEVIQVGQPIYMVVDASRYWVEANVEETEIRFIHPGSPVTIKVDSYPDREFAGKVIEVGGATVSEFSLFTPQKLTGQFIKSTQRLPVKISVTNTDGLLKVGMLAVVRIKKISH